MRIDDNEETHQETNFKLENMGVEDSNNKNQLVIDSLNNEMFLQTQLSILISENDQIGPEFFDRFHIEDAEMIFANISMFFNLRPFCKDAFVEHLLSFERFFGVSFLSYFERYENPGFLRRYYIHKGLSFELIRYYIKDNDSFQLYFSKELSLSTLENSNVYYDIFSDLIKDDWNLWNEIVTFGYMKGSLEYCIKFDCYNDLIAITSRIPFDFTIQLQTNDFDFITNYLELSLTCFCGLYGSEHCFKYFSLNNTPKSTHLFQYCVIGHNPSIIHFCDQNSFDLSYCIENAIIYHHYDLIEWLLLKESISSTMIHTIVQSRNVKLLMYYCFELYGFDSINLKDGKGKNLIHIISQNGHLSVAKLLITNGADVNACDECDWTSLHYALANGHLSVVELLVSSGADVNAKTQRGKTPLHYASQYGHLSAAELLISKGANIHEKSLYGISPLHKSSKYGHISIVELLVSNGTDINSKGRFGLTALHLASNRGHISIVEYLVSKGVDINEKCDDGWTALHFASANGFLLMVDLFISTGADMNAEDQYGETPLSCASTSEIESLLVSHGAK